MDSEVAVIKEARLKELNDELAKEAEAAKKREEEAEKTKESKEKVWYHILIVSRYSLADPLKLVRLVSCNLLVQSDSLNWSRIECIILTVCPSMSEQLS